MPVWLSIVLIVGCAIYIAWSYTKLWLENEQLKSEVNYDTNEINGDTAIRYILVGAKDSEYMTKLATTALRAHTEAHISIKKYEQDSEAIVHIVMDNKNEIIVWNYDKAPDYELKLPKLDKYAYKCFFDIKLPEGTERAIIQKLGLMNYMISIGICDKDTGSER